MEPSELTVWDVVLVLGASIAVPVVLAAVCAWLLWHSSDDPK